MKTEIFNNPYNDYFELYLITDDDQFGWLLADAYTKEDLKDYEAFLNQLSDSQMAIFVKHLKSNQGIWYLRRNANGGLECYCPIVHPLRNTVYTGLRLQFFKDTHSQLTVEYNGRVKVAYQADSEFDLFQYEEPELPIYYEEEINVDDLTVYEYAKDRHQKLCQHLLRNHYQFNNFGE